MNEHRPSKGATTIQDVDIGSTNQLNQIKQVEADINQKITNARQLSEKKLQDAWQEAAAIKEKARQEGLEAGKHEAEQIIHTARQSAKNQVQNVNIQAKNHADQLQKQKQLLINQAVAFVLSNDKEGLI